mmetsp:Transcript_155325/g.298174  ORF Transcript_155325/g.298174 Transcript_155325/m.298174 type:complete len:273 (+) Transcript_155325:303-1121(+)
MVTPASKLVLFVADQRCSRTFFVCNCAKPAHQSQRPHPLACCPFLVRRIFLCQTAVPLQQLVQSLPHHFAVRWHSDNGVENRTICCVSRHERRGVVDHLGEGNAKLQVQICVEATLSVQHRCPANVTSETSALLRRKHPDVLLLEVLPKVLETRFIIQPSHTELRVHLQRAHHIRAHLWDNVIQGRSVAREYHLRRYPSNAPQGISSYLAFFSATFLPLPACSKQILSNLHGHTLQCAVGASSNALQTGGAAIDSAAVAAVPFAAVAAVDGL